MLQASGFSLGPGHLGMHPLLLADSGPGIDAVLHGASTASQSLSRPDRERLCVVKSTNAGNFGSADRYEVANGRYSGM
jgi:hypothetical protein